MHVSRRSFVKTVGAALGVAPFVSYSFPLRQNPALEAKISTMAKALLQCSRNEALPVAVQLMKDGADWRQLLNAVLVAGAMEVQPKPVGFKLHALMVVGSAHQLAEVSTERQQQATALFCVDQLKRSQQLDKNEGDWVLPEAPNVSFGQEDARMAFISAMENWHQEEADRAITALHRFLDQPTLFELLWPYAVRDFNDIGHKAIFTAQVHYSLSQMPWNAALPVLRSLVKGLLDEPAIPHYKDFVLNKARVQRLNRDWMDGNRDHQASIHLLKKLRVADSAEAAALTAELLGDGVHPQSIWDGIRLFAGETLFRRPGLLPVHSATAANAMQMAYTLTTQSQTRALCLMQAASWMSLMRQFLEKNRLFTTDGPGLDSLQPIKSAKINVNEIFQKAATNHREAGSMLLTLLKEPGSEDRVKAEMRSLLTSRGNEHHHYKYTAAVHMDFHATAPQVAGHVLAAGLGYTPNLQNPKSKIYQRITALLEPK